MSAKGFKWAEVLAKLMDVAEELFASIEGFESGSLTAEVKANLDVKFIISRDSHGSVKAEFTVSPKMEKSEETAEEKVEETIELLEEESEGKTLF